MSNKKLLIANNEEVIQDNYNHYYQAYTGYPLVVENNKLCTDHPSYITEIYGNTTQDETNLTDIHSVGVLQEDGSYKVDIISTKKNLFNGSWSYGYIDSNGYSSSSNYYIITAFLPVEPGKTYTISSTQLKYVSSMKWAFYRSKTEYSVISGSITTGKSAVSPEEALYVRLSTGWYDRGNISLDCNLTLVEGTDTNLVLETKSIYLPQSLKAIGDYKDRLYWDYTLSKYCIEQNINIPKDYAQALDETLVLATPQIVETSITEKIAIDTYNPYMQITTDKLDVAPSNMSGEFAEKELLE